MGPYISGSLPCHSRGVGGHKISLMSSQNPHPSKTQRDQVRVTVCPGLRSEQRVGGVLGVANGAGQCIRNVSCME